MNTCVGVAGGVQGSMSRYNALKEEDTCTYYSEIRTTHTPRLVECDEEDQKVEGPTNW